MTARDQMSSMKCFIEIQKQALRRNFAAGLLPMNTAEYLYRTRFAAKGHAVAGEVKGFLLNLLLESTLGRRDRQRQFHAVFQAQCSVVGIILHAHGAAFSRGPPEGDGLFRSCQSRVAIE